MEFYLIEIAFLFGLIFGSFYNVVIYRLPKKLSLVRPGSSCPTCQHELTPLELIPVLSFIWQKGRCENCGQAIAWRYPLIELTTGLGFALIAWQSSSWPDFLVGTIFFSLLLILAFIDLDHKLLPNTLTLLGVALGLFFSLLGWNLTFTTSLIGGVVGFSLLFAIAIISRGGMGMGDVKMMAFIGTFLGWQAVFVVLFIASFFGSVGGLLYLYLTKQGRKTQIPFGPSLALGALLVYLLDIGNWLAWF